MNKQDLKTVELSWNRFFPNDRYFSNDRRIKLIELFKLFFCEHRDEMGLSFNFIEKSAVDINIAQLSKLISFGDFLPTLRAQPVEVMGCIGIALSVIASSSQNSHFVCVYPKLNYLRPLTPFSELKSNYVGQMVSIQGYVIRVSPTAPLVTAAKFRCPKCSALCLIPFEDGVFTTPQSCLTPKANYLELQRDMIQTTDYQRIKLQELDSSDTSTDTDNSNNHSDNHHHGNSNTNNSKIAMSRVPRSFEIELRDKGHDISSHLVNTTQAGDVVEVTGIIKSIQASENSFRSKNGAENGLQQLYIDAVSLKTIRSSGSSSFSSSSMPFTTSNASSQSQSQSQAHSNKRKFDPNVGKDGLPIQRTNSAMNTIDSVVYAPSAKPSISPLIDSMTLRVSQSRHAVGILLTSFCPHIYGNVLVKFGLLLGLFGGAGANETDGYGDSDVTGTLSIRKDIHVLVVGDPGLGKSELLRSASSAAPRAVSVCGNTATTAGLTVALVRDGRGGSSDSSIEAGALVLADRGVCCVDELDKMTCDPHSLLEAMEQQRISIAKGGVVTTLKSRTTVLAAANPAGGSYDKRKSISENLKIPSALLSRFDLVFILLDNPDVDRDRLISEHVMRRNSGGSRGAGGGGGEVLVRSGMKDVFATSPTEGLNGSQPEEEEGEGEEDMRTLSQRLQREMNKALHYDGEVISEFMTKMEQNEHLRTYVAHARQCCNPRLTPAAAKILQKQYMNMRAESCNGGLPVTTRHLESLIRLSQARAKMELRDEVTEADARDVVDLLHESLLDAYTSGTGRLDFGGKRGSNGPMSRPKQMKALVAAMRSDALRRNKMLFSAREIEEIALVLRIVKSDVADIIDMMRSECYLLLKGPKLYQLQSA